MSEHIHPLVLATIEEHRARKELELERLRSAREACSTASTGGQSRALALGKKIRETERVVQGWRLAVATLLDESQSVADAATEDEDRSDRVVGSITPVQKILRCVPCTIAVRRQHPRADLRDVTPDDLPHGGFCDDCRANLLT